MRFDLHTHTYYSDDAKASPEEIVSAAKKRGLDGIAVTDHNMTKGWKRAERAAKDKGLLLIRGEELKVLHGGRKVGEVIALFINEGMKPGELPELKDRIKSQGGIMVVAHPFDRFRNRYRMIEEHKRYFDAVEAFNARVVLDRFNRNAAIFAKENGFGVTGGSDGHCRYEIGNGYTQADVSEPEELMKAIKKRKTQALGKKTNPLIHTLSTIAKLGLVGRPSD